MQRTRCLNWRALFVMLLSWSEDHRQIKGDQPFGGLTDKTDAPVQHARRLGLGFRV